MQKKKIEIFSKSQIFEQNKISLLHSNVPTIVVTRFMDFSTTLDGVLESFLLDVLPRVICVVSEPSGCLLFRFSCIKFGVQVSFFRVFPTMVDRAI